MYRNIGFAAALLVSFAGCFGSKDRWEQTHPVTGTVSFKGTPVENAELAFYPVDGDAPDAVRPRAKSAEGGKYEAWTYEQGDGVPAGNYKVTVIHNEVAVSKGTIVAKPNSLPAKYSRLDTTDLQVEIVAGKNEIPAFELK